MDINFRIGFDLETLNAVKGLVSLLSQISTKETQLMSTLDDDIAAIAAQKTDLDKLMAFISGLEAQISAMPGITPVQQTAIDKIFADVTANNAEIVAAMAVNAPVVPVPSVPTPEPPVAPVVEPPVVVTPLPLAPGA
jgi:hypothetical protein